MKKICKTILICIGVIIGIVGGYLLYVIATYDRLPDHMELAAEAPKNAGLQEELQTGVSYQATTYNIGFGAYTPTYSFFMDGGKYSWAESEESTIATVSGAASLMEKLNSDFILFQEVDINGTRSYHVNQRAIIDTYFDTYYSTHAQNYDSSFLFWPLWQPHGKNKAELNTYSRYPIAEGERRSLPIADSFSKFVDLDRCYSVSRIPVENGKYLSIYTVHLSAYGNSDAVREGQIAMLMGDLQKDYESGNYVLCGGDFNHDLLAEDNGQKVESWAYPFSRENLPEGFYFALDLLDENTQNSLHHSARNADMPYVEGETYTVMLDGFILSDNISVTEYQVVDTGYQFSDHDPVTLKFVLQ